MSWKIEYIFQYPKKQTENRYMVNPAHLEQAVCIDMMEQQVDMVVVGTKDGNTILIATYSNQDGVKFFYHQKIKRKDIHIVFGSEICDAIDRIESCKIDAMTIGGEKDEFPTGDQILVLQNIDGTFIKRTFLSDNEADDYLKGVGDAMELTGNSDSYRIVDEDIYSIIKNRKAE